MNNYPIGILDSGVGGLSVYQEIVKLLPRESITYIADSKNAPYGEKSSEEIYQLAKRLIDFLLQKKVKLIVIACNTITVMCLNKLRQDYPNIPIIGTVPVIKTAVGVTRNKRVGILSTTRTAQSQYQKNLIRTFAKDCSITNIGTDELVPFIEKGEMTSEKLDYVLRNVLAVFQKEQIDTLALGCTHFPFLRKQIQTLLGEQVTLLDSGGAIARQVKRVLEHNNALSDKEKVDYTLFTTGELSALERFVRMQELTHDMIQSVIL